MYFMTNEMNYNKIHDKFDEIYSNKNIIKIRIINKIE